MWQSTNGDFVGFDMSYKELKQLCRGAWKQEQNIYLCIDRPIKRIGCKYCNCNESENEVNECIPGKNFF